MQTSDLALSFPRNHYANRKPSNLNLDTKLKEKATKVALHRYGYSLSELVNQLLKCEVNIKEGMLSKSFLGRRGVWGKKLQ